VIFGILIVLAALVAFIAFVNSKPNSFQLERSILIDAPPAKIRPLIENFRRWTAWSPWEKLDPDLQRTYLGADEGVGAAYAWEGNGKAGAGRMEITGSTPKQTALSLDFLKPFKASNITEFSYLPEGPATRVNWRMSGPQPFIGKLMHTVFNMDKLVGKDFEAGLAALKRAVEEG